nr:thioredoxin H2 [Ipomoea batatas]
MRGEALQGKLIGPASLSDPYEPCPAGSLGRLMVVDFAAAWCGPCKMMEPIVKQMATKFTDVDFIKIDVDELSDVAQEFSVQAMPTFLLLKQGKEVGRVVGAKKDELERKIVQHKEVPKFAA